METQTAAAAAEKLYPVRMLSRYRNVNQGEVAGFPWYECEELIKRGMAVEYNAEEIRQLPRRLADADSVPIPAEFQTLPTDQAMALAGKLCSPFPESEGEARETIRREADARFIAARQKSMRRPPEGESGQKKKLV